MGNNSQQAEQLQKIIYDTIPLAKASQLRVAELNTNSIRIEAPVPGINSNIHNTAFAGSIYSVCALTAWGLVHNRLLADDIKADVVIESAEINYIKPIKDTIISSCQLDASLFEDFNRRLDEIGKNRMLLKVQVHEQEKLTAEMSANIFVKKKV